LEGNVACVDDNRRQRVFGGGGRPPQVQTDAPTLIAKADVTVIPKSNRPNLMSNFPIG